MNRRMMVLTMAAALAAPGIAFGADKAKEQAEVRKAGQDALAAVYKRRRRRARPSNPRPATPRSATSA
jgi:type II secretory pathway pseudopilin PulG